MSRSVGGLKDSEEGAHDELKIGDFLVSKEPETEAFVAMSLQVILMGEDERGEEIEPTLLEVREYLVSMNGVGVPVRVRRPAKSYAVLRGKLMKLSPNGLRLVRSMGSRWNILHLMHDNSGHWGGKCNEGFHHGTHLVPHGSARCLPICGVLPRVPSGR